MKIALGTSIPTDDGSRASITVDHVIIYPGISMVINNKDGSSKTLDLGGLSKSTQGLYDSFIAALSVEIVDEYVNSGVTVRAKAAAKISTASISPSIAAAARLKP